MFIVDTVWECADANTPATHFILPEEDSPICGETEVRQRGMRATVESIIKNLDIQDLGWYYCPECAEYVTGLPHETITNYQY